MQSNTSMCIYKTENTMQIHHVNKFDNESTYILLPLF